MPDGIEWHARTQEWWNDLWSSPMAPEYDSSDRHGLFMYAMLVNDFWMSETITQRKDLMVRIESMWRFFGTAPLPRRALQWEIERAEDAQAAGKSRRARGALAAAPVEDPRSYLLAL